MDQTFISKIQTFLEIEKPTDDQVKAAAQMLLQIDPGRSRAIYNTAQRRPQAMLPWIRTDLKKHLDIRLRGLQRHEVPAYNQKAVEKVDETLSHRPESAPAEKAPVVPVTSVIGKRQDHDSLPENIKILWEKNHERWMKMRQLRAQLQTMIATPGYQACDGNELCHTLLEADTALRADYQRYDSYQTGDGAGSTSDNVKAAQAARTTISRALQRKNHTEKQLEDLQGAVNVLYRLGGTQKDATVKKLQALGVSVPDAKE